MTNLLSKVKKYKKLRDELCLSLSKSPNDWFRFQEIFDFNIDRIAEDILLSEKESRKVLKLREVFKKRYRQYFLCGEYVCWSFKKPFGYPGDFKIIDSIYLNQPSTSGFDRLWDNKYQKLDASMATRERKEDFKRIIKDVVNGHKRNNVRIMNLGSGPAREIKELLEEDIDRVFSKVIFDCYDFENSAIEYAKKLLNSPNNVNFFKKNVIRLALSKDLPKDIPWKYDLIYSMGLFDYLEEKVAVRLISNLRKLMNKGGVMVVTNYREKYTNASACLMEWIAEWNLIYRTRKEFEDLFFKSGFSPNELKIVSQKSGVMQYCFAKLT